MSNLNLSMNGKLTILLIFIKINMIVIGLKEIIHSIMVVIDELFR